MKELMRFLNFLLRLFGASFRAKQSQQALFLFLFFVFLKFLVAFFWRFFSRQTIAASSVSVFVFCVFEISCCDGNKIACN